MNSFKKGKLITIEGIEGVGKSTNVKFIAECLKKKGFEVVITREPGGTPLAEDVRKILLTEYREPTLVETELLLLYAGRMQHIAAVIQPALDQGKWVVCDRFNDATFAYQGAGRGYLMSKIESLDTWALGDFAPDYTIILDAPVEVAFERIAPHRTLDRFEKEQKAFFERIRQAYLARAALNPTRYQVIDATQTLTAVQQELQQFFEALS
ncbi:MAG: dTMP kinase [Candidatus Berkiellales bacterium]